MQLRWLGSVSLDERKEQQLKKEALDYHEAKPHGKIKVVPTKPHSTAHELSLAYSPGVAYPCLEFAEKLMNMKNYMSDVNTDNLSEKFGTLSNKELLNEYQNDEEYELTSEIMESSANIPTKEIQFNLNGK